VAEDEEHLSATLSDMHDEVWMFFKLQALTTAGANAPRIIKACMLFRTGGYVALSNQQ
jgi:hypothetical protein